MTWSSQSLVLTIISDFLRATLTEDYKIVSDLATPENYLFPPVLAITDLRPDLVVYNELMRDAIIIELTVPFESNFGKAQERKQGKYHGLMNDVKKNGFDVDLITIEVVSRGFVCPDGFDQLKDSIIASSRQIKDLMLNVSMASITGSYKIWTSRNHHPE